MDTLLKNKELMNSEVTIPIIEKILEWNKNSNLVLWSVNPDIRGLSKDIINAFGQMELIEDTYRFVYFDSNNQYVDFVNKHNTYNIFLSILYLEDIEEPYIKIRDGNLNEIYSNMNKQILIFECHQKSISYYKDISTWNSVVKEVLKNQIIEDDDDIESKRL